MAVFNFFANEDVRCRTLRDACVHALLLIFPQVCLQADECQSQAFVGMLRMTHTSWWTADLSRGTEEAPSASSRIDSSRTSGAFRKRPLLQPTLNGNRASNSRRGSSSSSSAMINGCAISPANCSECIYGTGRCTASTFIGHVGQESPLPLPSVYVEQSCMCGIVSHCIENVTTCGLRRSVRVSVSRVMSIRGPSRCPFAATGVHQ